MNSVTLEWLYYCFLWVTSKMTPWTLQPTTMSAINFIYDFNQHEFALTWQNINDCILNHFRPRPSLKKIVIRNYCYICEKVLRQLMDLVSKFFIRNHCYICEEILMTPIMLIDPVPKIVIRNHCYISEKVPRQLMDLVTKIVIRNHCYIYFFFFITNPCYINN